MRNIFTFCLILCPVLPLLSHAETARTPWTLNLYIENDLVNNTDHGYTNGTRFSWISPDISSYENDPALPEWIRHTNRRLSFFNDETAGLDRRFVVTFGQLMFTPEEIEAHELIEDDRPYAGYLYLGFAYHTRSRQQLDTIELNVGIVGPSALAHQTQDFVHDIVDSRKANGWDHQLRDEPAIQLIYEHKHRYRLSERWPEQDFIPHAGISLGNVASYLNLGAEYRIGWQLADDFGTSAVRPGSDNSAPAQPLAECPRIICGLHGFIGLDGRLVAHNIFLDGNTFKDSHSVDKRHAVADLYVGFGFNLKHWKVSFAQVYRTREFEKQDHPQQYGSLSISYHW